MSHLFVDTFSEFVVVENFAFVARITTILTSEAFGCMSQQDSKILPVLNKSCLFDVMSSNFRYTDRRSFTQHYCVYRFYCLLLSCACQLLINQYLI